ncbi:arginine repressor [Streptococcus sp. HF-1907]|uniref:arginine repressor n=1 Tax=Streptococcus sp. HF-1907 TaxID=2785793 RepID=UPI00189D043F|nr:arginine repressor [Streptococcus sp. HF-1907]MBF7094526.1 arginine repressor [Streptococcus sp. HF-1907]
MNKKERQSRIKELIQTGHISTQEEIKEQLQSEGITVTQATLSRDLREIGLLKLRNADGKLYYSLAAPVTSQFNPAIRSYILTVSRAEFMLILHTQLGEADVLANLIDDAGMSEVLGTIAGADTLLVVCKDASTAESLERELSDSL